MNKTRELPVLPLIAPIREALALVSDEEAGQAMKELLQGNTDDFMDTVDNIMDHTIRASVITVVLESWVFGVEEPDWMEHERDSWEAKGGES